MGVEDFKGKKANRKSQFLSPLYKMVKIYQVCLVPLSANIFQNVFHVTWVSLNLQNHRCILLKLSKKEEESSATAVHMHRPT